MLIDAAVVARLEGDLFDSFANELRNQQSLFQTVTRDPGLLFGNLNAERDFLRIMRRDFGADAIFQRRADLAARRVVLRIRRKHQHHVERQSHRITLNLHVALLHDVEEANLDFAGEVRQFIDREEAAIRARQKTIVNRELVAEQVAAFGRLDGIDIADDIGNGHVGRRQLLDEARVATDPVDMRGVTVQLNRLPPRRADGITRIVVDFRAGDDRDVFVKQIRKLTDDSALRLTAQPQQNQIAQREDCIDELWHNRLVITNDPGKKSFAPLEFANQVRAHLVFDRSRAITALLEFT